jgi:hypothetical protein
MEGKPAAKADILSPDGKVMEKAGAVRDGGSFYERMGKVACWNSVMTRTAIWSRSGMSSSRPERVAAGRRGGSACDPMSGKTSSRPEAASRSRAWLCRRRRWR